MYPPFRTRWNWMLSAKYQALANWLFETGRKAQAKALAHNVASTVYLHPLEAA